MTPTPGRGRVTAAFIAVYLIWGSTYLAIRYGVESFPPFLMAGLRFLSAGLILYGGDRARGAPRPTAVHWRSSLVIGALLLLGGNGLVTWAEKTVPSGVAALMVALVPLWMALMQAATDRFFRPTAAAWAGILLGFAGVGLLTGVGSGGTFDPRGLAALVAASFLWAAGSLYSRRAPLPSSTLLSVGMQMLCGGAWLLAAGVLTGEAAGFSPSAVTFRAGAALAYLIFLGAVVGFTCYAWLLKAAPPVAVSSYAYVNPVVAVLLGWALAGEPLTARILSAMAAITAGVALMTVFSRRRRGAES